MKLTPKALTAVALFGAVFAIVQPVSAEGNFTPFSVYTDESAPDNHFASTGWMGDYADITVDGAFTVNPRSGSTSIKVTYSKMASQGAGWAGVYWQEPGNNWGNRPGGFDLTGATKLTFWARGDKGGEVINEFKMGGIKGQYPDSTAAGIGPVVLTQEWKQYTINLTGKPLTNVIGGFCWATSLDKNPNGAVFYLDDIRYE
jgi:hypothetical protein